MPTPPTPPTPAASVAVRPARPSDGPAVAAIYAPYVTDTAITFDETPPTAAETTARIEAVLARYPYYVAEDAGRVVGYANAAAHRPRESYRWAVDVAVYVDRAARRAGVGRALYDVLLPDLARRGFLMAYAGITLPNDPSVGLHTAFGFSLVGVYRDVGYKLGAWRDVGWYERRLATEFPTDPPEPRWTT